MPSRLLIPRWVSRLQRAVSSVTTTHIDSYRLDSLLVFHTRRVRSRCTRVCPHRTIFFLNSSTAFVCLCHIDSRHCTPLDQERHRFLSVDIRHLVHRLHCCPCCCLVTRDSIRTEHSLYQTSFAMLSYLVESKEKNDRWERRQRRNDQQERYHAFSARAGGIA